MAFALADTGEHHMVDVFLGWACAAAVYAVVERVSLPRLHFAVPRRP